MRTNYVRFADFHAVIAKRAACYGNSKWIEIK